MKISEVIKELQEALAEHGDVGVRLQCDHGQSLMKVTGSGISYSLKEDWMIEDAYDSIEECENDTGVTPEYKFFELQAF